MKAKTRKNKHHQNNARHFLKQTQKKLEYCLDTLNSYLVKTAKAGTNYLTKLSRNCNTKKRKTHRKYRGGSVKPYNNLQTFPEATRVENIKTAQPLTWVW